MKKTALLCVLVAVSTSALAADAAKKASDKPELARDWVEMDANKDGYITPDEMLAWEKKRADAKK
ncbi:hypothetical protein [Methyloversatilis sp.]|uniref:hypothetical protein n=1 Tax=Methyloversatilis sp. TaxID=2569862 RepID=UPI0035B20429